MIVIRVTRDLPSFANISMHWAEKYKKFMQLKTDVMWCVLPYKRKILELKQPLTITLIRDGNRLLDSDNLIYAFKPIRDSIADVIWPQLSRNVRDSGEHVHWEYEQHKNKLKFITIEIYSSNK